MDTRTKFLKGLHELLEEYGIEMTGDTYIFCKKDPNFQGTLIVYNDIIEVEYEDERIAHYDFEDKK
jgi:hypothetical protein